MKLFTLKNALFFAPLMIGLAQTPPPAPKPAVPAVPAAPKPALKLEDLPGSDPVVMTIGDEKIYKSTFERLINSLPDAMKARINAPGGKKDIAEQVLTMKALAQEARRRGMDKSPDTKELLAFQMDSALANTLARELSTAVKPDDAAAKAYYEQHKSDYETAAARHILIRFKGSQVPLKQDEKELTEEEALAKAQDLRKKILAGEDFAKLAASESSDTGSGQKGGSLGEFPRGQMVPAFDEVAFKQPVGEVSEPIRTQFGYHLIKVDKRSSKSFDEAKADIARKMQPELAKQAVEAVRKQATVTMNDSYFAK